VIGIVAFLGGAVVAAVATRARSLKAFRATMERWARGIWLWTPPWIAFGLLFGLTSVDLSVGVVVIVAALGAFVATSYYLEPASNTRALVDAGRLEYSSWLVGAWIMFFGVGVASLALGQLIFL